MDINTFASWEPIPGRIIEIRATDAAIAAALEARADSEPGSFLQDNHLLSSAAGTAAGRPHRAYLGAITHVEGALDVVAMCTALTRFVNRHGGLRTRFTVSDDGVTRYAIPNAAVAFEAHTVGTLTPDLAVARTDMQWTGSVRDYFESLYGEQATALRWPGFAFGLIDHGWGFTMTWGVDHAISDGVSQGFALNEIHDFYRNEVAGEPLPAYLTVEAGDFADYARTERERATTFTADAADVVESVGIFLANGGGMPRFAMDLGLSPGDTAPWHGIHQLLLTDAHAEALEAVVRGAGGRMPSGIFAALATVDREIADSASYFAMNVVSSRGEGDFLLSQGWFCHFAPVAFDVSGANRFTEAVAMAHHGYRRGKRLAPVPPGLVFAGLLAAGTPPERVLVSPNLVSYIDFRQFPGLGSPAYDNGMQYTGEGRTGNASLWFNRESDGLYVGAQTPDTPFAQAQLARYFEHLTAVLTEIATTGDHLIATATASATADSVAEVPRCT